MALQLKKDYDVVTLLASTALSGAVSSTNTAAVRLAGMVNAVVFVLDVTGVVTDAADTLNVKVQTKLDGTNWVDVVHFTEVLGNGGSKRHVAKILAGAAESMFDVTAALGAGNIRDLLGDEWRVNYVVVDADADSTFTVKVTACPM